MGCSEALEGCSDGHGAQQDDRYLRRSTGRVKPYVSAAAAITVTMDARSGISVTLRRRRMSAPAAAAGASSQNA